MTEWLMENWLGVTALVAFGGSALIQISPLKVNPWSAIGSAIGSLIGLAEVRATLEKHIQLDDERYIKQCRMRILRFNDEILQGQKHTKEHFDEILDDVTEYERYCELHPGYRNGKARMAIANVEAAYRDHLSGKTFLQGGHDEG